LTEVIKALKKCPEFSFVRRDLLHPERIFAKKLSREGKTFRQIARNLWPDDFREEEKKIDSMKSLKKELRIRCEEYAIDLLYSRKEKSWPQAFRKAKETFNVKGKLQSTP